MSILVVAIKKLLKKTTIQIDKNRDRYIDRLPADSRPKYRTAIFWLSTKCRPTITWPSTECWPITDWYIGQESTNYRRSVREKSAKCRWSIGVRKAISAEIHLERLSTDYQPCLDRVSTDYRPLYRPSVDRLSTAISTDWSVDTTHSKHKTDWDLGTRLGIN